MTVFEFEEKDEDRVMRMLSFVFVDIVYKVAILLLLFVISLFRHGITIAVGASLLAPPLSVLPHRYENPVLE